jgi:peptidoglycan/LPS O-acetylase OafA/YrhL
MALQRRLPENIQGKQVSDDLDFIRGMAAVAVLIYHVRYRFFFDYVDVPRPNWFCKSYYGFTSFGHDAVIIFFVLSGYFISSSVIRDCAKERWSWRRYAINRLTRLYLVLLPGLLLTVFWDKLGIYFSPQHPVYTGIQQFWTSDYFDVASRLNGQTFIANALFLQTILAPPLGSNDALWSLSYEFWYYVLFPLFWIALVARPGFLLSFFGIALAVILLMFVGSNIAMYFPIWLLGTVVAIMPLIGRLKNPRPRWLSWFVIAAFCLALAATHVGPVKRFVGGSQLNVDRVTAILFAFALYVLLHNQSLANDGWFARISRRLAAFSYTLYLTHLPLLVFIRAMWTAPTPWYVAPTTLLFSLVLTLICLLYADLVFRVTENKTAAVREFFVNRWLPRSEKIALH